MGNWKTDSYKYGDPEVRPMSFLLVDLMKHLENFCRML